MTDPKKPCRRPFLLLFLLFATLHTLLVSPGWGDQGLPSLLPDARLRPGPAPLRAMAIEDDTLAVGTSDFTSAVGSVKVYRRTAGSWQLEATLAPPPGPPGGPEFGVSVAISGDTLVAGAPSLSGRVYVYVRADGAWTEQSVLDAPALDDPISFGAAVAISGDRLVVGAPGLSFSQHNGGFALTYTRTGDSWHRDGTFFGAADNYGSGVAMAGNQMAVGGDGGIDLLVRNRRAWRRQSRVEGGFGSPVLSGNTLGAVSSEGIFVWALIGGSSKLQAMIPVKPASSFEPILALDGDTLVVTTATGEVLVYVRQRSSWIASARLEPPVSNLDFGRAVALSGATAAIASNAPVWIFDGIP